VPAAHAKRIDHVTRAAARAARLLEGATPNEIVWSSGPACLRRYEPAPEAAAPDATPIFFVTPLINRYRVADLHPDATLVGSLLRRGIPVYLLDWGAPRRIDASLDFERCVDLIMRQAARRIPGDAFDLIGYCLGGTLAAIYAAAHPAGVRRLVTLNAPVRFLDAPDMDLMRTWVGDPERFPVERITRAFGNMPGRLVQQGFLWTKPVDTALKLWRTWSRFEDPGFAEYFAVLESWNHDAVDVPGAFYRRLICDLYRDDALARGAFALDGQAVDLGRIACPVKVVASRADTICPPEAALALLDLVGSTETRSLVLKGGHLNPIVGPKARGRLHDPLADWLFDRERAQPAE